MASLANKDEAEKCRDMAKKFLGRGEPQKAVRFFEKSLRLYPLPGVEALMRIAKSKARNGEAPSGTNSRTAPSERARPTNVNGHPTSSRSSSPRGNTRAEGGPGVRRRPTARTEGAGRGSEASNGGGTASASNGGGPGGGGSGGGGGGGGGGSGRAYTDEQERATKKVIHSKAKGHYAVLGVEKMATEDLIKKSYRKLALRFHPDKNGAPQAHEAFQAIGTAFAVLSDREKRVHYDRYGDDDGPQGTGGGFGSPFAGHGRHGGGQEVSPEDIFNMFFGGMQPGAAGNVRRGTAGPFRAHAAGGGGRARGGEGQQGGSAMNLLALLPFIMIMLLSLFGGQQEDIFRFRESSKYHVEKVTTPNTGVVEGIRYYVGTGFRQQYGVTREKLRRVEAQVTMTYQSYLRSECLELETRRNQRMKKARSRRKYVTREDYQKMVDDAETMPLPACDELMAKFSIFSQYN